MTVRDDRGAIVNREAYTYEFDKFGNWTKMVTSLVVFENGALKREPVEVTYRTLTYYFDDNIAKIVDEPKAPTVLSAPPVPEPSGGEVRNQKVLDLAVSASPSASVALEGNPPPMLQPSTPEGVESAYAARKRNETVEFVKSSAE